MHNQDWIERVRRKYLPGLHGVLSQLGLYAMGQSGEKRYSCTVYCSEDELEKALERIGFVRNPIAALKYRILKSRGKQISDGSWFFFTMEDPFYVYGVPLPKYQYHVTLYSTPDERAMDLYIHKELFWGTDPSGHYGGEFVKPVPDWLRQKLDMAGVEYKIKSNSSQT